MRILEAAAQLLDASGVDADCCVWARSVLRLAFGAGVVDLVPAWRWHLVVERGAGAWEPPRAAYDAGIADLVHGHLAGPLELERRRWYLLQGWRGTPLAPGVEGHTFLMRSVSTEVVLVVDSNRTRGPRWSGPTRWRDLVAGYRGGIAAALLSAPPR